MAKEPSLTERIAEHFLGADLKKRIREATAISNEYVQDEYLTPDRSSKLVLFGRYIPTLTDFALAGIALGEAYFGNLRGATFAAAGILVSEAYGYYFIESYINKLKGTARQAEINAREMRELNENARKLEDLPSEDVGDSVSDEFGSDNYDYE